MTAAMARLIDGNKAFIFALATLVLMAALAMPAQAAGKLQVFQSKQPFNEFIDHLKKEIKAAKMGVVSEACADCGAKSIGVTIPGNRVIMIFHPRFAVRMLKASTEAGIEAPLRLYVTEHPEGTRLSYYKASHVFAPYASSGDLVAMAKELDGIMLKIATEATQ